MVQIKIFLLLVVATVTSALAYIPLARREDGVFSRRFYNGDPFFAREKAPDLEQRDIMHRVLHPVDTLNEHRRVYAMSQAAKFHEKARIHEEHAASLRPPTLQEHLNALNQRDFDDFDFEARDFEDDY